MLHWLSRLHALSAALVLLFLSMAIGQAAMDGFQPTRQRYPASKPLNPVTTTKYIAGLFSHYKGKVIAILDAAPGEDVIPADGATSAESIDKLEEHLRRSGMLPRRSRGGDALQTARGADLVVLVHDVPSYRQINPADLAKVMRSPLVLDNTGVWNSGEFDAAGLVYFNAARMYWPHWLDPEMEQFATFVRNTVPPGEGILMVPNGPLQTTATRARWFLPLNARLLPRRLYLWHPEMGTSFVTTYYQWVNSYNQETPWRGTQKVRLDKRGLSKNLPSAPTRTLSPVEIQAAKNHDVQWILFWRHQPDFLLGDWELVPFTTVLSWSAKSPQNS